MAALLAFDIEPASVAAGADVTATVEVENFMLVEPEGGHDDHGHDDHGHDDHGAEADDNSGHVHVYLDDLMTNPVAMVGSTSFSITIPDGTAAGAHTLIARLHRADHTILDPEVSMEADLTVE